MPGGDVVSSGNRYPGVSRPPPRPSNPSPGGDVASSGRRYPGVSGRSSYTPPRAPVHSDVSSSPPHWQAQVNQFKQTPQYRQAVGQVFAAQALQQKASIIRGLSRNNAWDLPEGRAIRSYLGGLGAPELQGLTQQLHKLDPYDVKVNQAGFASDVGKALKFLSPSKVYGGEAGKSATGQNYMLGSVTPFGGKKGASTLLGNAGKDLVNLPAEAVSTVGVLGGDVLAGKPGKLAKDVLQPYAQLVEHPGESFIKHPLLSTLMAAGVAHGASRLAAAPLRAVAPKSSALGRALSTQREGVALTGQLTHERPPYSLSPTVKAMQVGAEKATYKRAPTGELVPRSEQMRLHQMNQEIGGLAGHLERIRAVNRDQVRAVRARAIAGTSTVNRTARRVAQSAKRTLAYGAKPATVPGADVLARIADLTVRRPETYTADLVKHAEQVSATRHSLLDDPQALKAHDEYVKALNKEIKANRSPKSVQPAFAAAEKYRQDYAPVEARAAKFGQFGDMNQGALERRTLSHFAVTHMGAKVDPERGLVDAAGSPLSNERILEEIKHPTRGTGGRLPAYTPDQVRFDRERAARQAGYVSPNRRPQPMTAPNTLYAYTHGLTNPSHSALTERHMLVQGVNDAHHAQNKIAETLATQKPGGGYWSTYQAAKRDSPAGYRPINLSQPFHPQESLDKALEGVSPATIEEEMARRAFDLSKRLEPGTAGRWAIIDEHALKVLRQHENQVSPNTALRSIRALNNQFRTVALSTSAKHVPGVTLENAIRSIGNGEGLRSWVSGRRLVGKVKEINPERGQQIRTHLTGGQVAGMTDVGKIYHVSDHWAGTSLHPFLRAMEATFKAPGPRQLRTAWRAWTAFAVRGTKKVLEEQSQIASLGKAALREHGYAEAAKAQGFVGLFERALGLHGKMLDDAAKGLFDPAKERQMRATINQVRGKWMDLSPGAQTGLMFSPFGLWWVNSVRWLARAPVDQPVKTGLLASATVGTQKQRQAQGLDMFMKGALPGYEQGGIPLHGGKILAENYYSPFGIANDPLATGQSLIQPWLTPLVLASSPGGLNWLGKPLSAPGQNTNKFNEKAPSASQRAQYIIDSALSSFLPLYTKAKQIAAGGVSQYDVTRSGVLPSLTPGAKVSRKGEKPPKGSASAGLGKALLPVREYKIQKPGAKRTRQPSPYGRGGGMNYGGFGSYGGDLGY